MFFKESVDTASTEDGYVPVSFEGMQEKMVAQLAAVNYVKTEGASKGVQGDQFILEYTRTNGWQTLSRWLLFGNSQF